MDILSAPELASKPRSGNARSDHTTSQNPWTARSAGVLLTANRETFIDVFPMPNDYCRRRPARTEQIQVTRSKNQCLPDLTPDEKSSACK
jgi:hypothetical protein